MRMRDKVVLVTGAASGIGKACAELFAEEGARVWVTDVDEPAAQQVAQPMPQHPGPASEYAFVPG